MGKPAGQCRDDRGLGGRRQVDARQPLAPMLGSRSSEAPIQPEQRIDGAEPDDTGPDDGDIDPSHPPGHARLDHAGEMQMRGVHQLGEELRSDGAVVVGVVHCVALRHR